MNILLLLPILAPLAAAGLAAGLGWGRLSASVTVLAALSVLVSGALIGFHVESGARFGAGNLLRADALSVTMLIVIGTVGTLATCGAASATSTPSSPTVTPTAKARTSTACWFPSSSPRWRWRSWPTTSG